MSTEFRTSSTSPHPTPEAFRPPIAVGEHAVQVQDIWMSFAGKQPGEQVHVLENVSATFRRGEFVCIVGPSGCGKSTLLNIIGGFLKLLRYPFKPRLTDRHIGEDELGFKDRHVAEDIHAAVRMGNRIVRKQPDDLHESVVVLDV